MREPVKLLDEWNGPFNNYLEFDTLVGPIFGNWQQQLPCSGSDCQSRRENIVMTKISFGFSTGIRLSLGHSPSCEQRTLPGKWATILASRFCA
jgi:hypothetical protein